MSLKKTAEDLLRIADEIEKEAAEVTQFVCDKCNHTANLATINGTREEVAKEAGENVTVSEVTINDKISCPACDGVMAYKATEESSGYYFDEKEAGDDNDDDNGDDDDNGEEASKKASEPTDYDQMERYLRG